MTGFSSSLGMVVPLGREIRARVTAPAPNNYGRCMELGAVLPTGFGDALHRLARGLGLCLREVAKRDDADQARVAVHHRQAAQLLLAHVLGPGAALLAPSAIAPLLPRHPFAA